METFVFKSHEQDSSYFPCELNLAGGNVIVETKQPLANARFEIEDCTECGPLATVFGNLRVGLRRTPLYLARTVKLGAHVTLRRVIHIGVNSSLSSQVINCRRTRPLNLLQICP
jgi:hypothetical protein